MTQLGLFTTSDLGEIISTIQLELIDRDVNVGVSSKSLGGRVEFNNVFDGAHFLNSRGEEVQRVIKGFSGELVLCFVSEGGRNSTIVIPATSGYRMEGHQVMSMDFTEAPEDLSLKGMAYHLKSPQPFDMSIYIQTSQNRNFI